MRFFSFRSINTMVSLLISSLLLIGITALVIFISTSSSRIISDLSSAGMATIDNDIVMGIDDMIHSNLSMIKVVAFNSDAQKAVKGEPNAAGLFLENLFKVYSDLNSIFIYNNKGIAVAGHTLNGDNIVGLDYSDRQYTKETNRGQEYVQGDIFQAKTTKKYIFVLAVPIVDEHGTVIGGAAVTVDWLAFVKKHILPIKFGENGYPFILDAKGRFIAHPDKEYMLKDVSTEAYAKTALAQKEGTSTYVFNGKSKVQHFKTVPQTGWVVSVSAREEDLTAAAASQRNTLIIACIATYLLLLAIILLILRKKVINPLRNIMEYSKKVAHGEFTAVLQGQFQYELHELAQSFQETTLVLKNRLGFSDGVLQGITFPVLVTDTNVKILYTNDAMLKMVGLTGSPKEYLGQTGAQFFYGDPNRKTINEKCIANNQNALGLETEMTFRDGRTRYLRVDASLIRDLDQKIVGAITLVADLTEIRQQQKQIETQNGLVAEAARGATAIADRLSTATEELSAQIEQSSRGAEIQAQRVSGTATAMEEMNASVLEVAQNAASAATVSGQAKGKAEEGAGIVNNVVQGIAELLRQATDLKTNMTALGAQAQNIGQIMNVISDIADQTNLLALNAAIEAARAGEAGRGFAVVADEVRKLAEKTMNATKEVGDAIHGIQDGTRKNVAQVEQTVTTIEATTTLANQSGEALAGIVTLVEQAADQARSIATAAEQQSSTSEEINRSVEEVNQISSETSEAMRQSAQAVEELAQQAQELKKIIAQMHVTEGTEPLPLAAGRTAAPRALPTR